MVLILALPFSPITVVAFIFVLGAAVILHEFGHFIVAKLFGIRVETFSFGFGPRLVGFKKGNTDYRISAVPLGGYVKLGGDESNAPIEGEGAPDIPAEERFDLRPRWQRFLVALAGPVMNILTALSIPFFAALLVGVQITPSPVVSAIVPGGAAERAGLQRGDRIVAFNGNTNPKWDTISGDALLSPSQPLALEVDRNGQRVTLTITPTPHTEEGETVGFLDFIPDYGNLPVTLRQVTPNSPASEAGLLVGDRLVAVNGEPVHSAEQVTQTIRARRGAPVTLQIERQGLQRDVTLTARKLEGETQERLGIQPAEVIPSQRLGGMASARYAVDKNVEIMRLTGKALGQMIAGKRSVRNTISGPIGIYSAVSTSVQRLGWDGLFSILGFLSLNLGLFNLLPIPVLDGGAIFLLLIEGLLALVGMTISMTMRERIQQVGFVVIIVLMVFVITNDVLKRWSLREGSNNAPATSSPAR